MKDLIAYTSDMEESLLFKKMAAIRRYKEISQSDLGEAAGMSKSNVSRFEANVHSPTFGSLSRYIKALGYDFKIVLIEK